MTAQDRKYGTPCLVCGAPIVDGRSVEHDVGCPMDMSEHGRRLYEVRELERVIRADPEGFYRLHIESDRTGAATRYLNITRAQLDRIAAVLAESGPS